MRIRKNLNKTGINKHYQHTCGVSLLPSGDQFALFEFCSDLGRPERDVFFEKCFRILLLMIICIVKEHQGIMI